MDKQNVIYYSDRLAVVDGIGSILVDIYFFSG